MGKIMTFRRFNRHLAPLIQPFVAIRLVLLAYAPKLASR